MTESYADGTIVIGVARRHGLTVQQLFAIELEGKVSRSLMLVVAAGVSSVMMTQAAAQPMDQLDTGNQFLNRCVPANRVWEAACNFSLKGIWETVRTLEEARQFSSKACPPLSTTWDHMKDALATYLQKNPDKRDTGLPALVIESMAAAFPCSGAPRQP